MALPIVQCEWYRTRRIGTDKNYWEIAYFNTLEIKGVNLSKDQLDTVIKEKKKIKKCVVGCIILF